MTSKKTPAPRRRLPATLMTPSVTPIHSNKHFEWDKENYDPYAHCYSPTYERLLQEKESGRVVLSKLQLRTKTRSHHTHQLTPDSKLCPSLAVFPTSSDNIYSMADTSSASSTSHASHTVPRYEFSRNASYDSEMSTMRKSPLSTHPVMTPLPLVDVTHMYDHDTMMGTSNDLTLENLFIDFKSSSKTATSRATTLEGNTMNFISDNSSPHKEDSTLFDMSDIIQDDVLDWGRVSVSDYRIDNDNLSTTEPDFTSLENITIQDPPPLEEASQSSYKEVAQRRLRRGIR